MKALKDGSLIVSVQTVGRKATYLRATAASLAEVVGTVEAMIADPEKFTIGKLKPTFKGRAPARKPDEEVLPGVEVNEKVEAVLA